MLRAALRDQDGDRDGAITDLERVAAALGPDAPPEVAEYLRQLRTETRPDAAPPKAAS